MKRLLLALAILICALTANSASAEDRYVVGYATRQAEGPALTVVTEVWVDPSESSLETLRGQFTARLGDRSKDFLSEVEVFAIRTEAEAFRKSLLDRASATGAVEELPITVAQASVGLWREHAEQFTEWPFGAAEAKRRQLLASEIWQLPLIVTAGGREFVLIPPGEFIMGSPEDEPGRSDDEVQHRVRITTPFYLAKFDEYFDTDRWGNALAKIFAQAPEGYRFRLPTEAEWEYAARAGTPGKTYALDGSIPGEHSDPVAVLRWNARKFHSWESQLLQLAQEREGEYARYYASCQVRSAGGWGSMPLPADPMPCRNMAMSLDDVYRLELQNLVELAEKPKPGPPQRFVPNAWGLYDMLGRYDEAVADLYRPYPTEPISVDPRQERDLLYIYRTGDYSGAEESGKAVNFVMRGGHFADQIEDMRLARRRAAGTTFLNYNYIAPNGIRLVLEKATGEAKSELRGDPFLRALEESKQSLGPIEKTGPDPLPEPGSRN